MTHELTHASFFSGVGGLDMGLERAGWRTVSFSEIDPYASAVLAQRWPEVPNLGDITEILPRGSGGSLGGSLCRESAGRPIRRRAGADWHHATLWTGGFPCQDLSVAGKRRGLAGARSGLAFAFLDLVERHRPPVVLLENVPGLLSSHGGKDLGTLLGRLGELGYGWAYRVLDARHFGVPQRRRRVFILAIHARLDPSGTGAAEVLSVGARCHRHPPTGVEAGEGVADGPGDGAIGTFTAGAHPGSYNGQDAYTGHLVASAVGSSPDPSRDGAADGLAGRLDDRGEVAATLNSGGNNGGFRTEPGEHLVALPIVPGGVSAASDPLLPDGLDSHRYRCCGNGVVSAVGEWIGQQIAAWLP